MCIFSHVFYDLDVNCSLQKHSEKALMPVVNKDLGNIGLKGEITSAEAILPRFHKTL